MAVRYVKPHDERQAGDVIAALLAVDASVALQPFV
jgi:hypothetical protein